MEQVIIRAGIQFHIAAAATILIILLCIIFFVFYFSLKGNKTDSSNVINERTLIETRNYSFMTLFFSIYTIAEPSVLLINNIKTTVMVTRVELAVSLYAIYFLIRLVHIYAHLDQDKKVVLFEKIYLICSFILAALFIFTEGLVASHSETFNIEGWNVIMGPFLLYLYGPILMGALVYSCITMFRARKYFLENKIERRRYVLITIGISWMGLMAIAESVRSLHIIPGLNALGDLSVLGITIMSLMLGLSAVYKFYAIQQENVKSENSLSVLINQINEILVNASQSLDHLGNTTAEFRSESEKILSYAKESQTATDESIDFANSEKEQIKFFSTMVIGNITTLEAILQSVTEQTQRIEDFFKVIGDISKILEDISEKGTVVSGGVVNLNSVISDAKKKSNKNYQLMIAVRNSIDSIVHISQTIEKISEDSNILAMNASIESANSGEAGKGFKVVADDLRSLSEMTKNETAKIQTILVKLNQDLKTGEDAARLVEVFFTELEAAIEKIFMFILNIVNQTKNIIPKLEDAKAEVSSLMEIAHKSEQFGKEQQELNNVLNDTIIDEKYLLESIRRAMEEERESLVVMLDFAESSYLEAKENTQFTQELMQLFEQIKSLFTENHSNKSDIKLVE